MKDTFGQLQRPYFFSRTFNFLKNWKNSATFETHGKSVKATDNITKIKIIPLLLKKSDHTDGESSNRLMHYMTLNGTSYQELL